MISKQKMKVTLVNIVAVDQLEEYIEFSRNKCIIEFCFI